MWRAAGLLAVGGLVGLGLGAFGGAGLRVLGGRALEAQPPGLKRTMLLRAEVDARDVLMGTAELAPGAAAGRHFHHGLEVGYVLEGTAVLEVEGQPPVPLRAGEAYHIPANRPHDVKNAGPGPARALAVYVVEKGRPLAVPAP